MNAKTVLKRLVSLLQAEEVQLTYAKLADGTIVESPTFDVGEPLEVVSEDGTKTPAPDGEHELTLKDTEGNETIIKVITKDGVIAERENVELADADAEIKEAEDIPATKPEDAPTEMAEETIETAPGDIPTTGDGIPAEEEGIDLVKKFEELAYRISELEKTIKMQGETEVEVNIDGEEDEEEELPKLDGAPVEASVKKFSSINNESKQTRALSTQDRVLARLYKK